MTLPSKKIAIQAMNHGKEITCHRCGCSSLPTASATNKILDDLTNKLITAVWNKEETIGTEGKLIVAEALELTNGLKSGFGVTTGYNTPDTLAYQMMEYNLFEFSASKTEARLAAMSDLLIDKEKNEIRSYPDFEKLASQRVASFDKEYLQTEYILSVSVGQNSADYLRAMEGKDDFPWMKYQTAFDSKVRDAHKKLDSLYINLNDKEAMQLWPPNGYRCRCTMIRSNRSNPPENKRITGKLAQEMMNAEDAKWSSSQFNINRGDLKVVFTKSQFYSDIKGLPKKLNEMTYDKYDLKTWDSFKSNLNPIELDNTITKDNVKELFKKETDSDFMGFKDYFGRKMFLTEKIFKEHCKEKYTTPKENRHQLFPLIKEILNNPDEVWYNTPDKIQGKFQSRYIKFYKDTMIIIDCEMKKDGLQINTWYQGKKEDLGLRKGLLVRNKVL